MARNSRKQLRERVEAALDPKQRNLCRDTIPMARMTVGHAHILQALCLVTGRTRRAIMEQLLEEMAHRHGFPAHPMPQLLRKSLSSAKLMGKHQMLQANRLKDDWPELFEAIVPVLRQRASAESTLRRDIEQSSRARAVKVEAITRMVAPEKVYPEKVTEEHISEAKFIQELEG